jgi:hypothetical protein
LAMHGAKLTAVDYGGNYPNEYQSGIGDETEAISRLGGFYGFFYELPKPIKGIAYWVIGAVLCFIGWVFLSWVLLLSIHEDNPRLFRLLLANRRHRGRWSSMVH